MKNNNSYRLKFPKILKELRKSKGFSQSKLAEMVGRKQQTIGTYEEGRSVPELDLLNEIADVLEISIDDLLGRPKKLESLGDLVAFITKSQLLDPELCSKLSSLVLQEKEEKEKVQAKYTKLLEAIEKKFNTRL